MVDKLETEISLTQAKAQGSQCSTKWTDGQVKPDDCDRCSDQRPSKYSLIAALITSGQDF